MTSGVLAGFPVVDVHVELNDGKFHDVDSSDMALKLLEQWPSKKQLVKQTSST